MDATIETHDLTKRFGPFTAGNRIVKTRERFVGIGSAQMYPLILDYDG